MKTDRELLELAAKAAGVKDFVFCAETGAPFDAVGYWNPLTDDGDALRLAGSLGLAIVPCPIYENPKHSVIVERKKLTTCKRASPPFKYCEECSGPCEMEMQISMIENYKGDHYAATRRAIVRAAAAIGDGMK